MAEIKFVDVKNDVAFRKIFGDERKKSIIISFLNAVLNLDGQAKIVDVNLVNPFQLPRIRGEKASIIDVRAKDLMDRSFIIEMQVAEKAGFGKRIQYYISKDYSAQIDIGEQYPKLKPVYFIGILDFNFFPNKNYFSKHLITDEETGECTLDDLKFRFIELKKFKKEAHELETIVDKWTYFIQRAHKLQFIPDNTNDEGLKAAYEAAQKHNWTKQEYDEYIYAGMRVQDARGELSFAVNKAVNIAIKEEAKRKNIQVIRKLRTKGMSVEDIADITELSTKEIEQIISEFEG